MDLYLVLGITKDSTQDEIKKAYRKKAIEFHPDKNPGNPTAEESFKAVNSAYEILGDVEKRSTYDKSQVTGSKFNADSFSGFNGGGMHMDDMFDQWSDIFQRGQQYRGSDETVFVSFNFSDMYSGCVKDVVTSSGIYTIKFPKGLHSGSSIKHPGLGGKPPKKEGISGDLYIKIREEKHPLYKREGDVITYRMKIGFADMVLGVTVIIPCIDGQVKVKIPAGMESGTKLKLKGKGFNGAHMEVEIVPFMPTNLSRRERELLEEMRTLPNMNELRSK